MSEGQTALSFGAAGINEALLYFSTAYELHPNNARAVRGLETVADRFLASLPTADATARREVFGLLYCNDYLSRYPRVAATCDSLLGQAQCAAIASTCQGADDGASEMSVATRILRPALVVLLAAGAAPALAQDPGSTPTAVQALQVVDCLLPGQVRVVGGRTYLTPRRPTRTTASDCGARGGEYLAYDRADYRSALAVWLPDRGARRRRGADVRGRDLRTRVGGEPNYGAAAEWYRRAAEQGNARAQFNLGTLYEQGLGVPADKLRR